MQKSKDTIEIRVCKKSFDALREAKKGTTIIISHNQYKGEILLKKVETRMPIRKISKSEIEKMLGYPIELVEEGESEKYRSTKVVKK